MSQMPSEEAADWPEVARLMNAARLGPARPSESPRQRLAVDLLEILTANPELVQGGHPDAGHWRDLPAMADACLEAAGKIYPEASANALMSDEDVRSFKAELEQPDFVPPPPAAVEGPQSVLTPAETAYVKETIQSFGPIEDELRGVSPDNRRGIILDKGRGA